MKFLSAKLQMTFGLVSLQASVLCSAMLFGFVPEQRSVIMQGRGNLCESVAIMSSQLLTQGHGNDVGVVLHEMVSRNPDLISACIRSEDEKLLEEIGDHAANWTLTGKRSTENQILVPIWAGDRQWGNVELCFTPVTKTGASAFFLHPWVLMTLFVSAISGILYYYYLRKMLKHLDPSKAVPKRVRAALDSLAEGLIVLDNQDRILLANQAFGDWIGIDPEKLTGVNVDSFAWTIQSADESHSGKPWADALEHETPQAGVMIGLTPEGKPQQNLMANASPVLGYDGKFGGVLVSFDDVTQLEETRRDLHQAKETAESAQQMAEEANRAKSDFLARMSHEIRTPMNAILGYTEVLRNGHDDNVNDRFSCLDTIHASGEHLLALINDILDLSKIESGQMQLDVDDHSLRDLISQVAAVMNVKAKEKTVALKIQARGKIPESIKTDAVRFRQMLFNLVGNAVKFTNEGEVRIVVGLTAEKLIQVDVIDTGVGIAADAIDKVFERFVQADASVSTNFGGTGLGLSIARQLANMMGGELSVSSVLGQGSTFTMTVNPGPLDGVALVGPESLTHSTASRSSQKSAIKLPPCHVLIVDDEKANRGLAGIHIRKAGGSFSEACDGLEAIEKTLNEDFDVILMDFNMPVMGGLEATRKLRELGIETPVVALTANVMQDDKDMAADAGCNAFLTKPLKMADLINTIARLIPKRSENVESAVPSQSNPAKESPAVIDTTTESPEQIINDMAAIVTTVDDAVAAGPATTGTTTEGLPSSEPIESSLPTEDPELHAIVAEFLPRLHSRLQLMRQVFEARDFAELREHAHWLAGTGETLGFAVFTEPSRSLESASVEQNQTIAEAALCEIESLAKRVRITEHNAPCARNGR